ncbi:hypothetical protein DH2020_012464 [Rehmannia glutinosa]|uniref:GH16 domain-containing protein n=1 Tax=Rehmannia glutinosa TaxID=99300 RepID=A0ABR0X027_REHGL
MDFKVSWSDSHIRQIEGGKAIQLILDQNSGCGFASKNKYLFGRVSMKIKLVPGDSAGTVTAFYMNSDTDNVRDELDFEFLGNRSGQPYTVQTNVYANGKGDREQRINLWFDPSAEFHTYSILWNHHHVVDAVHFSVYENNEARGIPFRNSTNGSLLPLSGGRRLGYRGGLEKIDWSKAPFYAYYKDFDIEGCSMSGPSSCASNPSNWWEVASHSTIEPRSSQALSLGPYEPHDLRLLHRQVPLPGYPTGMCGWNLIPGFSDGSMVN